jgi:FkbM family methyltransferase
MRRRLAWIAWRLARRYPEQTQFLALLLAVVSAAADVSPSLRFAGNELLRRQRLGAYRVRRSGMRIFVRHPWSDAWVVHEVLSRRVYRPPEPVARRLREHDRPLRIVDLGAHVGSTTLLMLELYPDAQVTAVEPNPSTAALLRRTIEANGLGGQCEVIQAAAGVAPGHVLMEGFSLLAHVVRDRDEVEAVDQLPFLREPQLRRGAPNRVEVVDILPVLAGADLVKIDIEGAEWPIFADPRFRELGIGALVLEYHPQGAPDADATAAASELLAGAGMTVGEPFDQHDGVGLVWAWRD